MREMTGGCLCGQVRIRRTPIRLLSRCATARTVRSRQGLLSQFWLAFQKQRFQFKATLKRSTILATVVNQLIETSVQYADHPSSLMLLLCLISDSSKLVLSSEPEPFPSEPRGMHWRRYERLRARHDQAVERSLKLLKI
jgi:hypothetical protein